MLFYDRVMANRTHQGFTLIEISIVLVIVGLVAGTVLVGRDMIRHAELVKLHSQYTEIVTAINSFRSKYNCLPGDCATATAFFDTATGCPDLSDTIYTPAAPALYANDISGTATCNGDGDGRIDANNTMYEMTTLWQQLAAAGLIGGAYTGGGSTQGGSIVLPGINCPVALSPARCWVIFDGDNSVWRGLLGNPPLTIVPIQLGTVMTVMQQFAPGWSSVPFTPQEALSYDAKYDDGSPVAGTILIAFGSTHCTNGNESVSSAANETAQYVGGNSVFSNTPSCNLIYRAGF